MKHRLLATGLVGLFLAFSVAPAAAEMAEPPAHQSIFEKIMNWFGSAPPPPPPMTTPDAPPPNLFTALPSLTLKPADQVVSEAEGKATVTIVRSEASGETGIGVHVVTKGDSAVDGKDFRALDQDVTFGPNETSRTIDIPIINDNVYEAGVRRLHVELQSPQHATIGKGGGSAQIGIKNDDPMPKKTAPAKLAVQPHRVDFGTVNVGSGRKTVREIAVINQGGEPSTNLAVKVDDRGEGVYNVVADECTGRAIGPRQECSVTLAFAPGAAGKFDGTLAFQASGTSASSLLSGSGLLPPIVEDPVGAWIAAAKAKRRKDGGVTKTFTEPPIEPTPPAKFANKDADYKSIGVGRNYFTYPVDRSRILDAVHTIIPCVLEDSINSSVPGFVHCVVEQNVFGADGRLVLIPKGTFVVGDYDSPKDSSSPPRLDIIWRRFMRPDGSSITVKDGFQSMDVAGGTAVPAYVDNRYKDRYGAAVLTTALTVAAGLVVPDSNQQGSTAVKTLSDNMGQIAFQQLQDKLDLPPILTVPAGTRLIINPLVDLWFKTPNELAQVTPESGAVKRN